jgi:hypothetical protein
MPAAITRSAPASFDVHVAAEVRTGLHRFLAGISSRVVFSLREASSSRPDYMRPALERDAQAAARFFAAGPQLVRTRRLRHRLTAPVLDASAYRRLVIDEVAAAVRPIQAYRPTMVSELDQLLSRAVPAKRQRDARTMLDLMGRATGEQPVVYGTGVGYGSYHYRYASGREGDAPAAGFAPRRSALVVYVVDGVGAHAALLDKLGPHSTGVGCIYIKDLEQVDLAVLEQIVARSYATLTKGTYTLRAREGGQDPGRRLLRLHAAARARV